VQRLLIGRGQLHAVLVPARRHVCHWCLLRLGSYTVEITVPPDRRLTRKSSCSGCAAAPGGASAEPGPAGTGRVRRR
jgi:hypothetical protein